PAFKGGNYWLCLPIKTKCCRQSRVDTRALAPVETSLLYIIRSKKRYLAADKKEDADPKISGEGYSTHSTRVSPNKIRAERSEQETDSATDQFRNRKSNQNSQDANPRVRPPGKGQPGITISNGSSSHPKNG
ncbi:MAG: hypothetical protein NXI29_28770, partial [bacterium]|nr:hypothetical protein [bacterium]